ncbi:MAG: ATP phosphoribosyltransferase regulatory subunit [Spirochaetales bacterium]|nr:ATP phosphoribosyltransferase regulatory subunit [Spirochaetales bacterium]
MTEKLNRFLQVPMGTETIYIEDAYRHRRANEELGKLFTSWGYLPVETPVFDFFDIYQDFIPVEKDIYRLIDREGDLLMLRSDITLFLAKQMGLSLKDTDLPVRVCYSGTILRHQNREDISKNEFFQTGAELIGKKDNNADLEILMLLHSTFKSLEVEPIVHIGSRKLLNASISGFKELDKKQIMDMISYRDFENLKIKLEDKIDKERTDFLINLFQFIGTTQELRNFIETSEAAIISKEKTALVDLMHIMDNLAKLNADNNFIIDLSEVGNQPYYTGIVFQGYIEGVDSAVVSGGRYDDLLSKFGFAAPSVGFSLLLRKIEDKLGKKFSLPNQENIIEKDFISAFKKAEKIRKDGRIAIL